MRMQAKEKCTASACQSRRGREGARIRPRQGDAAPNLNKRGGVPRPNFHNLLRLNVICDAALVINASAPVACANTEARAPRNERDFHHFVLHATPYVHRLCLAHKTKDAGHDVLMCTRICKDGP
jgi:hypothetical protein